MKQIKGNKTGKVITVKLPSKSTMQQHRKEKDQIAEHYRSLYGLPSGVARVAAEMTNTPTTIMAGLKLGRSIITGQGDYQVQGSGVPSFKKAESAIITHREYITDIKSGALSGGASVFDISKYPLNPGVSRTFPWLANIAANYEEYELLGMVFNFVATSGESVASTNTSLGTVILATEYDPTKPDFVNKQAMENYSFSTSAKPSVSQIHAIECKKSLSPVKQLYVRSGTITGTDLRWSDFGNFFIATVGCPAAGTNLGELWVSYRVRLHKPRLPITVGLGGQIATGYVERSGVVSASPGGTATLVTKGAIAVTVSSGGEVRWPALPNMNYLITICVRAATSVQPISTLVGFINCAADNLYNNGTTAAQISGNVGTVSVTNVTVSCTSTDTDDFCAFTYGAGVIVGAATAEVTVTQVDETYD